MEVIIVDEYTGRKMVGRQWSEGLHQAIEAKEKVPIKQETQTLATITLQNFFKLYKALAGMTGTAQTEAEEFGKIYKLDVVTIPTNRPCIRTDNDDRVYRKPHEKWEAIIDEIKKYSDAGRPVLVGTTSVEKSEMLSNLLKRRYGIEHEVLNAKQHEREASIVLKAGQQHENVHGELVGNVTIATNMAGRGTDIKLAPQSIFDVEKDPSDPSPNKLVAIQRGTGKRTPFENTTDSAYFTPRGVNITGGLHVIGTERHTARRIDNQLRGRGGRQGDPGSSRFFVSLEDELMQMFAGEWTIKVLGWLGMEEGMAIEDKRITKGIVRAQKKVEERNFMARKNLLDYDEVMDFQRTSFYGMRQKVLEGREVDKIIWGMIGESIEDAVRKYIQEDYVSACIAEWTRMNFDITVEPENFRGLRAMIDLENYVKSQARNEVVHAVEATLGEFMGEDPDEKEWDTRSLSSWAMSRFQVNLPQNQIRRMSREEVEDTIKTAATEQIDKRDCAGLVRFLEPLFAEQALCEWAREKFAVRADPKELLADESRGMRKQPADIVELILARARESYARRQIEYPVDHVLAFTFGGEDQATDNPYAADHIRGWAMMKFREELSLEEIRTGSIRRLRDRLIGLMEQFLVDGRLEKEIDAMIAAHADPAELARAVNGRFGTSLSGEDVELLVTEDPELPPTPTPAAAKAALKSALLRIGRGFLYRELTDLEQFILIQIFDQSWKDHLYTMDMLRASIGLQAFAERDPRIAYKKEGFRCFEEMMEGIRDKVTDLIFRARLVGQGEARSAYNVTSAQHEQIDGYGVGENVAAANRMIGEGQKKEGDGEQASAGGEAAAAVVKPIHREAPKVGRNDPCPCGSGKKYKKCCGAHAA
jgi:preprotein translocase subunit SecA